jgi:hypothetical protein
MAKWLNGWTFYAILTSCCSIGILVLFICVFYLYIPYEQHLVSAKCTVEDCDVDSVQCSSTTCSGSGNSRHCTTHYYTCYDSTIHYYLNLTGKIYHKSDSNRYSWQSSANDRCDKHPDGSSISCYYGKNITIVLTFRR